MVVAWAILRSIVATRTPNPSGSSEVSHDGFQPVLAALADGGLGAAALHTEDLERYVSELASHDPDELAPKETVAFWLNLYNAVAVRLGVKAWRSGEDSVLRLPGGFRREAVTVAGEALSLDDIEHGKLRRLGEPRIHGALVCGALSCPTLRATPYTGNRLDDQLDDQLRSFLRSGGVVLDGEKAMFSRVFLWYGSDFVRPHRMPTFLPSPRNSVRAALSPWLAPEIRKATEIGFQSYDWGLACSVG